MAKVIAFDTETTGFVEPEIIEAAWVEIRDIDSFMCFNSFEARYKPTKPIELGALSTHHILDTELDGCPPSASFALPDDVVYLIGHNIDFDWGVIGKPDIKRICTLALARKYLPGLDSHKQSALIYHFYEDAPSTARDMVKNAHSALPDVVNCVIVLRFLIGIIRDSGVVIDDWSDLWDVSEEARIPEIMTFGKHKGDHMRDVPRSYKQWLLRQEDMDPYVRLSIERFW